MVDDDPIVRADVHLVLEDAGFDMCPGASDGEEAVELARAHRPDLILMDLGLPGIDGVEATRRILGERDVPIVALSGHASAVVERALAAGAVAHVAKPFEQMQLVRTIRGALAGQLPGVTASGHAELAGHRLARLPGWKRLGEHMAALGVIGNEELAAALNEQGRTGGRLGDILLSRGLLDPTALSLVLAHQNDLPSFVPEYEATPLLPRGVAYRQRAAVLVGPMGPTEMPAAQLVAVTDLASVPALSAALGSPIAPRLTDARTMDGLLADAYANLDASEVALAQKRWRLLRVALVAVVVALIVGAGVGAVLELGPVALVGAIALASVYYLLIAAEFIRAWAAPVCVRVLLMPDGSEPRPLVRPSCTVLIVLRHETPARLHRLRLDLAELDYPPHRLQGVAVFDSTDRRTRKALRSQPLPPWVTVFEAPDSARGRRGLALYGLRQARGELLTLVGSHRGVTVRVLERAAEVRGNLAWRFLREADARLRRPSHGHFGTAELLAAFGWLDDSPFAGSESR